MHPRNVNSSAWSHDKDLELKEEGYEDVLVKFRTLIEDLQLRRQGQKLVDANKKFIN